MRGGGSCCGPLLLRRGASASRIPQDGIHGSGVVEATARSAHGNNSTAVSRGPDARANEPVRRGRSRGGGQVWSPHASTIAGHEGFTFTGPEKGAAGTRKEHLASSFSRALFGAFGGGRKKTPPAAGTHTTKEEAFDDHPWPPGRAPVPIRPNRTSRPKSGRVGVAARGAAEHRISASGLIHAQKRARRCCCPKEVFCGASSRCAPRPNLFAPHRSSRCLGAEA